MSDANDQRSLRPRLNQLRIAELRNILMDLNLPRSGRKLELVDRIVNEMDLFADKARETASAAFYAERLSAGMRSIEQQLRERSSYVPSCQVVQGNYQSPQISAPYAPMVPTASPNPSIPVALYGHSASARDPIPYGTVNSVAPVTGVIPLTSGVDLYHPTKAAALDNARCFCTMQNVSGRVAKCADCGLALSGEWHCEVCRANSYDPFYRVQKTVLGPSFVRFAKPTSYFRLEYYITDNDLNNMYARKDPKPQSMTPGSLELQLRCFALKEDLGAGHCWPACTQVTVNGFRVPITQRAPPGHANPSKVLRELPGNIFQFSRVGRNVAEIRTTENPSVFGFLVQIVEVRNIDDLIDEVKEASKHLTYDAAKQGVIKSFGSEDEDDVVATVTMLSFIKAADLRIDPYLKELLAEVEGEEELEEIEIFPDGSWKRRLEEDAVAEQAVKRLKSEQAAVKAPSTNSTSTSAVPAASTSSLQGPLGSCATAPVEIDLLSSDEEEETTGANASTTASVPEATTILRDEDIDLLTVSSDVWDTPSAPASMNTTSEGDGNCGEYFPFPLDENLFPSNGASTNSGNGNPTSSWMYSVPVSTIVANMPPTTTVASSTPLIASAQDLLNQAESHLASSMALLSRNHSVNNPFEQRQRRQVHAPQRARAIPNDMDIICLLDSDSD
ncbi:hypothetical protein PsorP6_008522 [Peronosclerospora sorghi]|uniref:Uncharacterized protein n=1 Tax=Peronosclerospora sorghi TaxID=230839 RepID=A0ACC0WD05_9STRA|nr:hypothetical protein PsorP6_008522 [Peronosclerospora sorghi]